MIVFHILYIHCMHVFIARALGRIFATSSIHGIGYLWSFMLAKNWVPLQKKPVWVSYGRIYATA